MARILIIDDDDSFREALAEAVRDLGHDVVLTKSAQEAFEFINHVDATFLDLKMPGVPGIDFLREARPTTPVIVLTAFADSSNTIEAIKRGAFDHLTKPIGRSRQASFRCRQLRCHPRRVTRKRAVWTRERCVYRSISTSPGQVSRSRGRNTISR
jgi:DNA-binding NtrC family response regulator